MPCPRESASMPTSSRWARTSAVAQLPPPVPDLLVLRGVGRHHHLLAPPLLQEGTRKPVRFDRASLCRVRHCCSRSAAEVSQQSAAEALPCGRRVNVVVPITVNDNVCTGASRAPAEALPWVRRIGVEVRIKENDSVRAGAPRALAELLPRRRRGGVEVAMTENCYASARRRGSVEVTITEDDYVCPGTLRAMAEALRSQRRLLKLRLYQHSGGLLKLRLYQHSGGIPRLAPVPTLRPE